VSSAATSAFVVDGPLRAFSSSRLGTPARRPRRQAELRRWASPDFRVSREQPHPAPPGRHRKMPF